MIRLIVADSQYLIREGLKSIVRKRDDIEVSDEASDFAELKEKLGKKEYDVLMIDYTDPEFPELETIDLLKKNDINVLAITPKQSKNCLLKGIDAGIISYLLKGCDSQEIVDAIRMTAKKENFFCGQIIEKILEEEPDESNSEELVNRVYEKCEPLKITTRELEILKLIAQGKTNLEIADQLFISNHTVVTHRKNLMKKLGISNTAGLVMYAVQEDIINLENTPKS